MTSIPIILRKMPNGYWKLFLPNGDAIGPGYRGDKYKAMEWARNFVSTWSDWTVKLCEGETDEKTD